MLLKKLQKKKSVHSFIFTLFIQPITKTLLIHIINPYSILEIEFANELTAWLPGDPICAEPLWILWNPSLELNVGVPLCHIQHFQVSIEHLEWLCMKDNANFQLARSYKGVKQQTLTEANTSLRRVAFSRNMKILLIY